MNASPLRRSRVLLATAAALAALSLTACEDEVASSGGGEEQTGQETPAEQDDAGTDDSADTGGTTGGDGDEAGEETGVEPGQGTLEGGAGEDGETPVSEPCTDSNTEVTLSPVERPINHLLLTVTNTGDEACNAYSAPAIGIDDAQAPLPRVQESVPHAVATLNPGESAYAGIITSSAEGGEGWTTSSLTLYFTGGEDEGSVGGPVDLPLPDGELYVDGAAAVTYWQTSLEDALMW
ncbi:DUF4232 domain-containing protein [Streptomyces sp. DSM 44915]|uniref:DUF4232 domain-containing protein n=1 Tax=Streptomyces chisholmiae TaxID=3075540 RepID=A0ABU2JX92_9ACTN|nr:DUF4232 domain-containing protein [Streptomyces sp. DSM 44915]MDT0269613.1 DUF4232 domain-containing protein [Streptomyces sp. DSM 44915]